MFKKPASLKMYKLAGYSGCITTLFGSSARLCSAWYYDIRGQVTQSVSGNHLGGYETVNATYTLTGKPLTFNHVHTGKDKPTRTEVYTYDHTDCLMQTDHTLNGIKVTLAVNTYDKYGRLATKSLHGSAANKLTYTYNLRNWLTGISNVVFTQEHRLWKPLLQRKHQQHDLEGRR